MNNHSNYEVLFKIEKKVWKPVNGKDLKKPSFVNNHDLINKSIGDSNENTEALGYDDNVWLKKRGYKYVDDENKEKLINSYNMGITVKNSAKTLRINYSTAKHII